jgi:hypothetical protein
VLTGAAIEDLTAIGLTGHCVDLASNRGSTAHDRALALDRDRGAMV